MNKIVVIDWGHFLHTNGFLWMSTIKKKLDLKSDEEIDYYKAKQLIIPATYHATNSIIANLTRIGVNKNDMVILAIDYLSSWRKEIIKVYKKGRRKLLPELYAEFDWLLNALNTSTNWQIVKIPHLEADDVMAVASRFYKDNEVVLNTIDTDLEQCWQYENVKIFSPKSKRYKIKPINFNVYVLLAQKIRKEASDGMVSPILNTKHYKDREKVITLLKLPSWVEQSIIAELESLEDKVGNLDLIPFKSLRARFETLYNQDKVVSYEKCVKYYERKKGRQNAKKKTKSKKVD